MEGKPERVVDYDELLSSAGKFGKYQLYLFFITGPFYIFDVFAYFSQLFMTEVSPNHWCWIPELENLTAVERRTLAIPSDPNSRFGYSQCSTYNANWTEVLSTGQYPNTSWAVQECQYGWEFNKTEIPYPTISSELGWVCDKNSYQATAQSIFFLGSIVGGFIIGWIADKYGRLPAATISNMIGCVAGVISIFANDIIQFSICRFIMGMCYDNCMMMTYLLVLEYVAPKYRTVITNLPFAIFFTFGAMILPWIALACNDWKILSLATSVPMALALLAPFIIPESPRWLLSKNRVDEAVQKVVNIGKVNGVPVPVKLVEEFKESFKNQRNEESTSSLEIFRRPLTRKVFICVCLEYMCCVIVFDALLRSIGALGFDFFLSFTLISFTEFPSLILITLTLDIIGRKWMSITSLAICAVFCILTAFVGEGLPSVICAIIARFAVNISVSVGMQWCAEVVPTSVRGSAASIVHICGYLATGISPYIVYLGNFFIWLPLLIVGLLSIIGALCACVIPETGGKEMPQTFADAENMILNQKFFDIPCLEKKKEKHVAGEHNNSFELN
ncbi:unnamed protein product [Pieris macdunnoughi]|uniref:Major facilitator superfamily (MFS) profile domain-containing protein n=1 Tax=Pieris macdunnoughi TaxID=345717 RepID=A0A821Y3S7_9NEOP|nr:unnamed protein product [Pieris macdunnoughi]